MRDDPDLVLRLIWECENISQEDAEALDAEARTLFGNWFQTQGGVSFSMQDSRVIWDYFHAENTAKTATRNVHLVVNIIPKPGAEQKALNARDALTEDDQGTLGHVVGGLRSWLRQEHRRTFIVRVDRDRIEQTIPSGSATE